MSVRKVGRCGWSGGGWSCAGWPVWPCAGALPLCLRRRASPAPRRLCRSAGFDVCWTRATTEAVRQRAGDEHGAREAKRSVNMGELTLMNRGLDARRGTRACLLDDTIRRMLGPVHVGPICWPVSLRSVRVHVCPHLLTEDEQLLFERARVCLARDRAARAGDGRAGGIPGGSRAEAVRPRRHGHRDSRALGGGGGTFFHAVLAVEALARVDASVAVLVDVQNTLVINALTRWGTTS